MPVSTVATAYGQGLYNPKATSAGTVLGSLMWSDSRVYRYCQAGATPLVAGNVLQAAPPVAGHQGLSVAVAGNIGDRTITVTNGATAVTANQYAQGMAMVVGAPGNGFCYLIGSHPALPGAGALTLTLMEPLAAALTAGSKISLVPSSYAGVIAAPATTLTGAVVGVATSATPAGYFDWMQVAGVAPVLIAGTPAVGQSVSAPSAVAGAAAINSGTLAIIGQMLATGVDTQNGPVLLTGFSV